jgi:hypothetical protein
LTFRSITGCDTTSFFYGILKKKTYKVYDQDANLLEGIGEAELTDEKIKLAEAFIGKLYNQVTDTSDEARDLMFGKSKSLESLPSTSDALKLHIERAHFQASVWKQANVVKLVLPSPITMGWSLDGDRLIPLLMTLDPIPQAYLEMISCQCSTGCITLLCSCKKPNCHAQTSVNVIRVNMSNVLILGFSYMPKTHEIVIYACAKKVYIY